MANLPAFSINPQSGVTGGGGGQMPVAPTLGIDGGNNKTGVNPRQQMDPVQLSDAGIPEFLNDAFGPAIQAAQQERFWEGFTKARAQDGLEGVAKDGSWFSHIFGPTPYEQGADLFATQKGVSDVTQQFQQQMPELRQLKSGEIGKAINDMSANAMTGDPYADAAIQKQLIQAAGPMMEQHAKEHYAWQQQQLSQTQFDAMGSAAGAYQASMVNYAKLGQDHPDQMPTAEQSAELTRNFIDTLTPPNTQDPKSYADTLVKGVTAMAEGGNWYAVKAIQKSGVLSSLPIDSQDHLQTAIDRAGAKAHTALVQDPDAMKQVSQFMSQVDEGYLSPEQTLSGMQNLNRIYAARTGQDDYPLFPANDITSKVTKSSDLVYKMWDKNNRQQMAAAEKASTAAEKLAAAARQNATIATAATTGSLGSLHSLNAVPKEDLDQGFMSTVQASPTPENIANLAVRNASATDPFYSDTLKTRLQNSINLTGGQQYTDGFGAAYTQWQAIRYRQKPTVDPVTKEPGAMTTDPNGYGTAVSYYTQELNDRMQHLDDQVKSGIPLTAAYEINFGETSNFNAPDLHGLTQEATQNNRDAVSKVVDNLSPGFFSSSMSQSTKDQLSAALSRGFEAAKRNNPGMQPDVAASQALRIEQSKGLNVSGRYVWQDAPGQVSLAQYSNMVDPDGRTPRSDFNNAFDQVITSEFKKQGVDVDSDSNLSLIRLGDNAQGPVMFAMSWGTDGTSKSFMITGDTLKKINREAVKSSKDAAVKTQQFKNDLRAAAQPWAGF